MAVSNWARMSCRRERLLQLVCCVVGMTLAQAAVAMKHPQVTLHSPSSAAPAQRLGARAPSYPRPLDINTVYVRDPTIIYNNLTGQYVVAGTDDRLVYFSSSSLTGPYERHDSLLAQKPKIDNPGSDSPWAPDLHYVNGKFYAYYTVSQLETSHSAIGVAVSDSGQPGTFQDYGAMFNTSNGDNYNALDPNLVPDRRHLLYGSYFSGLYIIPLNDDLVSVKQSDLPGERVVSNYPYDNAVEGGFIYRKDGWYYLFVSAGQCCGFQGPIPKYDTKEYKVMVGRSRDVTGPYTDRMGKSMDNGGGTLVLSSFQDIYAPGGQSIFKDPKSGRDVMAFHYSNPKDPNSYAQLGIYYLDFSSGWPKVRNA